MEPKKKRIWLVFGIVFLISIGGVFGDELILQDADTENLDDTKIRKGDINDNFGSNVQLNIGTYDFGANDYETAMIKFNISSIPIGSTINEASLFLYLTNDDFAEGNNLRVYKYENITWEESTLTYANTNFSEITDLLYENTEETYDGFEYFNVTDGVDSNDITNGKISFYINSSWQGSYSENSNFYSKEYTTNVSRRPYLNITYTPPVAQDYSAHVKLWQEHMRLKGNSHWRFYG